MSIFGKLDAANIPTNPFWVEKGEYSAEVVAAAYKTNRDGQRQLFLQYQINDQESQFLDSKVQHYFNLIDPDMTAEMFALLPGDEQKKLRQAMANVKKTLCGADGNEKQPGLGVDPDDLNDDDWKPDVLVGTPVRIAIDNWGAKNEGVNIKWVNIDRG